MTTILIKIAVVFSLSRPHLLLCGNPVLYGSEPVSGEVVYLATVIKGSGGQTKTKSYYFGYSSKQQFEEEMIAGGNILQRTRAGLQAADVYDVIIVQN